MSDNRQRFDRAISDGVTSQGYETAGFGSENDGAFYDGIGAELRDERIRCGLHLHEVAARLRIREAHLDAIEAGRFGDLPGRIYAIGFVRSYAEFLGADGDVCISMFKAEIGPGGHSRKLVFPVPPSESRRPGIWMLAASVALAVMVYAGWYTWQGDEHRAAELVPEVPQRFVEQAEIAQVRDQSALSSIASANASESPTANSPGDGSDLSGGAQQEERTTLDLAVVGRVTAEETASSDGVAETPADDDAENGDSGTEQSTPPVVAAVEGEPREPAPAAVAVDEPQSDEGGSENARLAAVIPPPIPEVEPQESNKPRVLGTANRGARVLIRATEQVQIIVKRRSGQIIMPHRVLNPGDIYRAPNNSDVVLETANPGALQLIVDGRLIGRGDRIARGGSIGLDADSLRSIGN